MMARAADAFRYCGGGDTSVPAEPTVCADGSKNNSQLSHEKVGAMSAVTNVSRPSAAASAAVGNVMSPGCTEIALVNGTDGRTSWEFAPAILPLLSVDAAVAEAMRQRQPEANDALPISSAARMRQEHEAAISSAAGASRSAEDRDGFEGEFEDTAAKMHPILRGVLIDDKVYEDATALVALLDCAALTSTRLVVRRPRMISLEGCAARSITIVT